MASRTILIAGGGTGGHLMPALAIADAIRQRHPGHRVALAGAERGIEAAILPSRPYPFHLLPTQPLFRRQWWRNLSWPVRAVGVVRAVDRLLDEEKPDLVIGTGGYAAGPVVWRAARRGIPTAIQEQNAYPGLASRLLAGRVREIWLSVPETRRHLRPGPRTVVVETGSPIAPPDAALRAEGFRRFGLDAARPVLLITGGSQGALALNEAVAGWIASGGAAGIQLLWSAGQATADRFRQLHRPPEVQLFEFLDPIAPAYAVASLAVCRAGMTTIAELCAWGIPAILVPLPSAAADHQTHNARVLSEAGGAVLLPQAELTPLRLGTEVSRLLGSPGELAAMASRARARGHPEAAERIVERIGVCLG